MIKRIISLMLILVISFNLVIISHSEEQPTTEAINSIGLLKALNIIDGEYIPEENITRNDFVKYIYFLAGFAETDNKKNIPAPFLDVSEKDSYVHYINTVKSMNLISGYSDNTFRGDEKISFMEAMTVTIRLLGYSKLASAKGGYPTGYNIVAKELRILNGIDNTYNGYITKGDLAILLANALETPVYSVTEVSSDGVKMESGNPLMETSFHMHQVKGIMEANELTRITGDAIDVPSRGIIVNGHLIHTGKLNPKEYLGYSVKAYCRTDSGICELVYICENPGFNNIKEINLEDIEEISGYTVITGSDNGKSIKYKYDNIASIIYNGSYTAAPFEYSLVSGKNGSLTLVDNDKDSIADVVFVKSYVSVVVGATDSSDYKIYDNYDNTLSENLDLERDEPFVLLFDESGNEIPFSKITKYSVVTIEETLPDAGQAYKRATVSNKKISGKIESFGQDDIGWYMIIDGKEIRLTDKCYLNCASEILAGKYVEAGFDVYGNGAYVKPAAGEVSFGYVITAGTTGSFEGDAVIKIYLTGDTFKTYTLADKVNIDGSVYKKGDLRVFSHLNKGAEINQYVNGALPSATVIPSDLYAQIVRFSCNENEEINMIDTVVNTFDGSVVIGNKDNISGDNRLYMENFGTLNYKTNGRNFGGKMIVKAGSPVFRVPSPLSENLKNEDMYAMTDNKFFTDNSNHNISAFYDGSEQLSASIFAVKSNAATSVFDGESAMGIFSHYTTVLGEDGTKMKRLYIYEAGKQTVSDVPETIEINGIGNVSNLKPGDMIYYTTDVNGIVDYILVYYRAYNNTFIPGTNRGTDWADPRRIVSGYVNKIYDDGFSYKVTENINDMYADNGFNTAISGAYPVMVYDSSVQSDRNKVAVGSYEDILGFEKSGTDCSKIVIQQRYTQTKLVYIIK